MQKGNWHLGLRFLLVLGLALVGLKSFAQDVMAAGVAANAKGATEGDSGTGTLLKSPQSAYAFSVQSIDGKLVNLADYKGKVALIVNVASRCGYTPQYKDLEALYLKYEAQGLVVLGFPSNDFFSQEPGSNEDIKKFCKAKYDVTFPLFEKHPVSGSEKQPLYKFLTEHSGQATQGEIKWNFTKFLIGREGHVAARFEPAVKPLSSEITKKVEELLK